MFREGYASRILADVMKVIAEEKNVKDDVDETDTNKENDVRNTDNKKSKDEDTN